MPALAITDLGNLMAAFHFEKAVTKYNKELEKECADALKAGEEFNKKQILPIIGCAFNVCANHLDKSRQDNGAQVVLLAKNKNGYQLSIINASFHNLN